MKRFTATEKWGKSWFQELSILEKLFWNFLCDNCDLAGVWEPNFKQASFQMGAKVSPETMKAFSGKIALLKNGKYWITSFVEFQYGKLSKDCRPHVRIFALIEKHGLNDVEKDTLSDTLSNGVSNTHKDKEEDKDKDKEITEGGCKGEIESEQIYAHYPNKVAKAYGLKAIEKALKKFPYDFLLEKTQAYSVARNGDLAFVPNPATWFNGEQFNDDPKTWIPKRNGKPQIEIDYAKF